MSGSLQEETRGTDEISEYLEPTLNQLRLLHEFEIESQVQFYAPLAFRPEHVTEGPSDSWHYTLNREDITIFVNSAEWTLCKHKPTRLHIIDSYSLERF